jgi:DNA-binding NarL/FixJ family response regulator
MLTVFDDDDHIFECLKLGASGYILKRTSPAKILEAIQEVQAGGSPMSASIARKVTQHFSRFSSEEFQLTDREKELLSHLVKGLSYKMIAAEMKVTIHTVQQHIKHIYTKLHVHNMGEAVAKAIQHRIV